MACASSAELDGVLADGDNEDRSAAIAPKSSPESQRANRVKFSRISRLSQNLPFGTSHSDSHRRHVLCKRKIKPVPMCRGGSDRSVSQIRVAERKGSTGIS